jgi:hypothetical protein
VPVVEIENVSNRFRRQIVQPCTSLKTTFYGFLLHRQFRQRDSLLQALKGIPLAARTSLPMIFAIGSMPSPSNLHCTTSGCAENPSDGRSSRSFQCLCRESSLIACEPRTSLQVEPAGRYTAWERVDEKSFDHRNYWAGRVIFS